MTTNYMRASIQKLACFSRTKFIMKLRGTHYIIKITAILISLDDVLWNDTD
jgi:hypothetical protein